jgi:hypothetical protein
MMHEPIIPVAPALGRRVAGVATVIPCSNNPGWLISTVQPYLAIGSRVQLDRSQRNRRSTLHQRSPRIRRFQRSGLSGLQDLPRPGRSKIYGQDPETLVIQTATSRPPDLGLSFATWSLGKLETHLRGHSPLKSLSRETIRRILARHGLRFLTGAKGGGMF